MQRAITTARKAISTVETAKMTADEVVSMEMSNCVKRLASPAEPGEKLKAIYGRLAKETGLTYGQVKRIWKREWKVVPGRVVRLLDKKLAEHERKLNAQQANQKQYWALRNQSSDPDFYSVRTASDDQPTDEVG